MFLGIVFASAIAMPDPARSETSNPAIMVYSALPVSRPKYSVPEKTKRLLFYVQRSMNANTVVYEANLRSNGDYDREKPVLVRWRRFASNGVAKKLSLLENWAYGITVNAGDGSKKSLRVHITSYPYRSVKIGIDKSGVPIATLRAGKHRIKLIYVFVQLKKSLLIPLIEYVDIFGQDLATGAYIRERIGNNSRKHSPVNVNTR
ncbi:MAG: DUF4833 domain-containing protein [Gammaproteobacteria bacterium]|nr:DUF4833 domain-containing protein [Gammaproteobacteria bacterium]